MNGEKDKARTKQVATRLSPELMSKVEALTCGEGAPFVSVSDYLTTLITQDVARRESGMSVTVQAVLEVLRDPEVRAYLKKELK